MPRRPVPADRGPEDSRPGAQPGPGWEPVVTRPDPESEQEREAWLDHVAGLDEPFDPEEWYDPEGPPPPGEDELTPEEIAGIRQASADEMLALKAASAGRRGTGSPGPRGFFPASRPARRRASGPGWRWT
jgi:hypothetical protein